MFRSAAGRAPIPGCSRTVLLSVLITLPTGLQAQTPVIDPGSSQSYLSANNGDTSAPIQQTLVNANAAVQLTTPNGGQRAEAWTALGVGVLNNTVDSYAQLQYDFEMSGMDPTPLDATVSMAVEWRGIFYGAGVLGTEASVNIVADLVNGSGQVTGSALVTNEKLASTSIKGISVGGNPITGSKTVTFKAVVIRGQAHSIRLRVTCESKTGLVGADVGCDFAGSLAQSPIPDAVMQDRHVTWTDLSLTVNEDTSATLSQILQNQKDMEASLKTIQQNQQQMEATQNEILRLLTTPQGLRSTGIPACSGDPCSFPNGTPGSSNGSGNAQGAPVTAGPPANTGPPSNAGPPANAGPPDNAGPPATSGAPDNAGPPSNAGPPPQAGPPSNAGPPATPLGKSKG